MEEPRIVTDDSVILKTVGGTEYQLVNGVLMKRLPFASGWTPAGPEEIKTNPVYIRAREAIFSGIEYAIIREMPLADVQRVGVGNQKTVHRVRLGLDEWVYFRTTINILEDEELNKELSS